VLALLVAGVRAGRADGYLRPEWSVGQDLVSVDMLTVTPPPAAPAELSIQDAVSVALQRNIGFRRTIQDLLRARSAFYVASQRWDLEVFGSADRVSNGDSFSETRAGSSLRYGALTGAEFSVRAELDRLDSEESSSTLTASLSQPLLAGSGRASAAYEELRSARNAYRSALLSYFVDRQDLVVNVISSYFDAVERQSLVQIQRSSVALAEQAVKDAEMRLEAGLIAEIDLTRAQLRLARAQADAVLAQQSQQDTMDRLLLLLGLQVGGNPKLVTMVSYQPVPVDAEAAVKQALELRPEIRLSDLSLENRQAGLRLSRSRSLPTLDLSGSYRRTRNSVDDRSWDIGVQASIPVGSRALTEAVRQAYWALLVAQQDQQDLRQRVTTEVRSQARSAEAARQNVDIATKSLEVAQRSLQIAGRMVEEGLATNRDVLDSQDELTRSETSLVSSKINYYLSTVRLRRAMGLDVSAGLPTARVEEAPATGATPPASPPATAEQGREG
jgi:outer membrane protein TolC